MTIRCGGLVSEQCDHRNRFRGVDEKQWRFSGHPGAIFINRRKFDYAAGDKWIRRAICLSPFLSSGLLLAVMDMGSVALLLLLLTFASNTNANVTYLDVGEVTIQLPVTFSFVGSIQCLNSGQCGNTTGSDYWTLGAVAAAFQDIDNRPDLYYFHNMTFSFFDLINTGLRSIE
jgi:hypothetical protein